MTSRAKQWGNFVALPPQEEEEKEPRVLALTGTMTMMGLSTLSLSSSTAMVIDGKVLALTGSKRQSLSHKRQTHFL